MAKPNPGAALRHIMNAAKELIPGLTDEEIAEKIGVRHPSLIAWTKHGVIPRAPKRAAMRKYLSGIIEALPAAFAELETDGADDEVEPLGPRATQPEAS